MNEVHHKVYLNLGSNIQPEINLARALQILSECGEVREVSNTWESRSVGAHASNYFNACVLFLLPLNKFDLKEKIIRPIETRLGCERSENKYISRTIDIDIILFDDQPHKDSFWNEAFVIVPLAEIYLDYQNPLTREPISATADRISREVWMEARPKVLSQFSEGHWRT